MPSVEALPEIYMILGSIGQVMSYPKGKLMLITGSFFFILFFLHFPISRHWTYPIVMGKSNHQLNNLQELRSCGYGLLWTKYYLMRRRWIKLRFPFSYFFLFISNKKMPRTKRSRIPVNRRSLLCQKREPGKPETSETPSVRELDPLSISCSVHRTR